MWGRLGSIWRLAEGERRRYALALAALFAASLFLYLAPLVPQVTIDRVLTAGGGDVAAEASLGDRLSERLVSLMGGRAFVGANLWCPAALVLGLTAVAGIFTYLRGRLCAYGAESITQRVRDRLYDQLQHLPIRYFDSAKTGDLLQRCTSDVETLHAFLAVQVVEIGRAAVMLMLPLPLMLMIDVRMTVISVVLVPPIVIFSLVYFARVRSLFKLTDEAEGRVTTTIQENLTGIRVVRAFARQEFEREKLHATNDAHRRLDYRLYVLLARFWSVSDFLCFFQKALVVGAGAYLLAVGSLQVGAYYYFLTAVSLFIWPVRMMGRLLTELGKALVAVERIDEVLSAPRETDAAGVPTIPEIKGAIEFDRVTFAHGKESPALEEASFSVAPGETLAVLGPSGGGKSTIVNLLLRLYDHDGGAIRIDGHDLAELDRKFVRSQMAVVMQEPFLYSKSLRENITMGRPTAGEEEMVEAASIACVHESILDFEEGYDTRVGERGVTLSGGQRQRVALARALLQEPAILVLDDALSAVDTGTEALILGALRQRHGRHTTIVIAHRLSTLRHADRVIVLERGCVVQQGTHDALVDADGLYRRLWTIQNAALEEDGPSATAATTRGRSER